MGLGPPWCQRDACCSGSVRRRRGGVLFGILVGILKGTQQGPRRVERLFQLVQGERMNRYVPQENCFCELDVQIGRLAFVAHLSMQPERLAKRPVGGRVWAIVAQKATLCRNLKVAV